MAGSTCGLLDHALQDQTERQDSVPDDEGAKVQCAHGRVCGSRTLHDAQDEGHASQDGDEVGRRTLAWMRRAHRRAPDRTRQWRVSRVQRAPETGGQPMVIGPSREYGRYAERANAGSPSAPASNADAQACVGTQS